jgi:hypothetical protein
LIGLRSWRETCKFVFPFLTSRGLAETWKCLFHSTFKPQGQIRLNLVIHNLTFKYINDDTLSVQTFVLAYLIIVMSV